MKTCRLITLISTSCLLSCSTLEETEDLSPTPSHWGPTTFQIDGSINNGQLTYFAKTDSLNLIYYSSDPVPESDLPFRFYLDFFLRYPEIIISSPYPIRANWFQVYTSDCVDPGKTAAGIEFTVTTARERDYLLIARLDSTYWQCLTQTSHPINFAFQILNTAPVKPTKFALRGFYDQERELVSLKAFQDSPGIWYPTYDYQVHQEPGPRDFTIQVSKPAHLSPDYSLIRIGSSMQLLPQSVWIGLAGECLDLADWEVHRNRHNNRFLLDIVIPDCYLECLNKVADGFEFEVAFFQ